jgi:hypothetical protein
VAQEGVLQNLLLHAATIHAHVCSPCSATNHAQQVASTLYFNHGLHMHMQSAHGIAPQPTASTTVQHRGMHLCGPHCNMHKLSALPRYQKGAGQPQEPLAGCSHQKAAAAGPAGGLWVTFTKAGHRPQVIKECESLAHILWGPENRSDLDLCGMC